MQESETPYTDEELYDPYFPYFSGDMNYGEECLDLEEPHHYHALEKQDISGSLSEDVYVCVCVCVCVCPLGTGQVIEPAGNLYSLVNQLHYEE